MTDINTIMSSPFVRVKLVAFVHFIFIVFAMMASHLPVVMMFYNTIFMVALFWAIHCKESADAVLTAAVVNACSTIFDLISIISFFPSLNGWSLAFSIINLVFRPFTTLLLYREFNERGGTVTTGTIFPTQQKSYEDIDRPNQPVPTNSQTPNVASIF